MISPPEAENLALCREYRVETSAGAYGTAAFNGPPGIETQAWAPPLHLLPSCNQKTIICHSERREESRFFGSRDSSRRCAPFRMTKTLIAG
jgi:hypothetical protein